MLKYLILFAGGFVLSFLLTPQVRRLALFVGAIDLPNARKVHQRPVPRMGGLAVFDSFHVVAFVGLWLFGVGAYPDPVLDRRWWIGFLPASTIIVVLGLWDDVHPLAARVKLLVQLAAALVAVHAGLVIDHVTLPWGGMVRLGLFGVPLTVLWIVGLTNAFNLVDGLDGLASGVALIASVTLAVVSVLNQQIELALLCSVLAGCLAGFLRYNFHPASIFLGDTGSLFIGFTLAVLSIKTSQKSATAFSIVIPILAFGLPVMDTLLAMVRRFLRAAHVLETGPEGTYRFFFLRGRTMFEADRDHIHHRLMRLGITHRNCVIVLYGVCAAVAGVALALAAFRNLNAGLILLVTGLATAYAIRKLRYEELEMLRNGTFLPLTRLRWLGYASFQMLMDVGLVAAACYLSFWIHFDGRLQDAQKGCFIATLPVVLLTKILIFHLSRLYRVKWELAGVPELLRCLRSMVLGCGSAWLLVGLLPVGGSTRGVCLMDFFLTTSFLLGARFSLRLLEYYARSNPQRKRRTLIYGADSTSRVLMEELLANQQHALLPVGFIDDDPAKRHKLLHGFPILGSFATLAELIHTTDAKELILAGAEISPDRLQIIKDCCRRYGVRLRQFHVKLDEVHLAPAE